MSFIFGFIGTLRGAVVTIIDCLFSVLDGNLPPLILFTFAKSLNRQALVSIGGNTEFYVMSACCQFFKDSCFYSLQNVT